MHDLNSRLTTPFMRIAGTIDTPLELFGGLVTDTAAADLPQGVSPDCQDVSFLQDAVKTRPGILPVFSPIADNPTVNYLKTFTQRNLARTLLAPDSTRPLAPGESPRLQCLSTTKSYKVYPGYLNIIKKDGTRVTIPASPLGTTLDPVQAHAKSIFLNSFPSSLFGVPNDDRSHYPITIGGTKLKNPPLDFLLVCSRASLQDFELGRLNQMANLVKQIHAIENELRQIEAEALLARWLMDYREELLAAHSERERELQRSFEFISGVAPLRCAIENPRRKIRA
jgi:hypothetical protein